MLAVLALLPVAYLLGTFPRAAIVARARGHDILREGSGNPGASNTFRLLGWKAGLLVLTLDVGKGAAAAGVGLALDGHRGAFILGVFPLETVVIGAAWFAIARGLRKASVASIVCALAFPAIVAVRDGSAL